MRKFKTSRLIVAVALNAKVIVLVNKIYQLIYVAKNGLFCNGWPQRNTTVHLQRP